MRAMILAAGLGTRLRPMTNNLPKPLLPVAGRPLMMYSLLWLKKYGIRDVIINLHYQGEKIEKELGDGARLGMNIAYSREPEILGTGGGIKKAVRFLSGPHAGSFVVVNGDILVDTNLDKVVEFHHRKKATATMVLREDPRAAAYGTIEIDAKGMVRQFLGRLPQNSTEKLTPLMFTGIHILEHKALSYIPAHRFYPITEAYLAMLTKGERICGYMMKGYWSDLGTPERYREADTALTKGRTRLSYIR